MTPKSILALVLVSSVSFAQTKPAPAPKPVLESAKVFAESEVKRLEKALEAASNDPNLSPCEYYTLKVQQKYNHWFLEPAHFSELEKMNTSIDSAIKTVNEKLASLQNETVAVLVQQGQNAQSAEVPVAFKDLVKFFRLYDQRMKSCPKDEQAALLQMMESEPETNPMHVVLSQVRAAGGMMSVNLNASLQDQGATFELLMTPKTCGYDLELQVKVEVGGVEQAYRFSLLSGDVSSNKIALTEKAKWELLSKGKVDGMPVDGLLRYRQIQEEFSDKCNKLQFISPRSLGIPYVKYSEIPALTAVKVAKMKFVAIKPGTFKMGSPSSEPGREVTELQHTVTLTKGFEMQTTEVTQAQWFEVMKSNPSYFKRQSDCPKTWSADLDGIGMCPDHPVDRVSWDDVQGFIEELNRRAGGYRYRLPTEAEWEYAARAGTTGYYSSGKNGEQAGWIRSNSEDHTHEVAKLSPNAYGLYDVHGNVWEWVQDGFEEYTSSAQTNPKGSSASSARSLRGGSYQSRVDYARSAVRTYSNPANAYDEAGFRLVRTKIAQ